MVSMTMNSYLVDVRYAVEQLLEGIWTEYRIFEELTKEVAKLTAYTHEEYRRVDRILAVDPDDDEGIATGLHWDTYFGPDKERHYKNVDLGVLQARVQLKEFSMNSLAGGILQIGKQGMSLVKGGLAQSSSGRLIGTQPLKDVIWQGRNQSMHWEEGKLSPSVQQCFKTLESEIGPQFGQFTTSSTAFEVVKALDWRDFGAFEKDMKSLAP